MKKLLDYTLILVLGVLVLGGVRDNIVYASKKEVANDKNYNIEVSYNGRELESEEIDDIINKGRNEDKMTLKDLTNKYKEILLDISDKI